MGRWLGGWFVGSLVCWLGDGWEVGCGFGLGEKIHIGEKIHTHIGEEKNPHPLVRRKQSLAQSFVPP
ncbi:MAG: hypothetical protein K9L75_00615 [Spirochaetia bacterium]|nr:hypothetical protein [Spirochaetia bacterium]